MTADEVTRDERRQARIAASWRYDAGCERQAQLKATDPAEYERVFGARGHLQLGLYEQQKAAAEAAGRDTSPPEEQP